MSGTRYYQVLNALVRPPGRCPPTPCWSSGCVDSQASQQKAAKAARGHLTQPIGSAR